MISFRFLRVWAFASFLAFFGTLPATAGPVSYRVSVDTSEFALTAGYIDFQFNPFIVGGAVARATVSDFSGDLTLDGTPTLDGGAVGALPDPQSFINTDVLNASLQAVMFGNGFSFDLTLDGPLSGSDDPTAFFLGIYDLAFSPILGADDLTGLSLGFLLRGGSLPEVTSFDDAITVTPLNAIPEPASAILVLLALGALGMSGKMRHLKKPMA